MLVFCIKHEYSLRNGWVTHKWSNKFEIDKISFFISWNIFAISAEVTPGVFLAPKISWQVFWTNTRRESTKMSTLISLTRISAGHSGRLVAPSSCKMGAMSHSQESPAMVWWSSLGHSSSMGSSESWYEHHREFVDSVETRSCQVTSCNKQRGTEGKDFVSLEEPWKKTRCPEEPVWFNAQTCLCLGPV